MMEDLLAGFKMILDDVILMDTNTLIPDIKPLLRKPLHSLEQSYIREINDKITMASKAVQDEGVFIIPEIYQEYTQYANRLFARISRFDSKYFVSNLSNSQRRTHKKNFKLLKETTLLVHSSLDNSYDAIKDERPNGFEYMYSCLNLLKYNRNVFRSNTKKPSHLDWKSIDVDIKLVSTALAQSLFENKEVQIHSNDLDVIRLLVATKKIFSRGVYQQKSFGLFTKLKQQPVEVYSYHKGSFLDEKDFRVQMQRKIFNRIFSQTHIHNNLISAYKSIDI